MRPASPFSRCCSRLPLAPATHCPSPTACSLTSPWLWPGWAGGAEAVCMVATRQLMAGASRARRGLRSGAALAGFSHWTPARTVHLLEGSGKQRTPDGQGSEVPLWLARTFNNDLTSRASGPSVVKQLSVSRENAPQVGFLPFPFLPAQRPRGKGLGTQCHVHTPQNTVKPKLGAQAPPSGQGSGCHRGRCQTAWRWAPEHVFLSCPSDAWGPRML